MKIFHVAGTNGKGSVCAFLSSALKEAGLCCGAFTSPPSFGYPGTVSDPGEMVSREAFDQAFETVYRAAGQWTAQGSRIPLILSFFFLYGDGAVFQSRRRSWCWRPAWEAFTM